jgi:hypothetical protein
MTRGDAPGEFPNGVGSGVIKFQVNDAGEPMAFQFAPPQPFQEFPTAIGRVETVRRWNRLTFEPQTSEMELCGTVHLHLQFLPCFPGRYTTRQIGTSKPTILRWSTLSHARRYPKHLNTIFQLSKPVFC